MMAAFDAEAYIGEAIESVLAQTHGDWELLVVDDGSTDGTASTVRSFGDERIRLLSGPHVGVLGRVRNRGIAAARGDSIALLDADDVWLDDKLARQTAVLDTRPEVGVVHAAAALLVDGRRHEPARSPRGPLFRSLLESNFLVSSSALVRRTVLDEHGAFDPDPALDGAPDYDLWLRLAPRTTFAFLDEVLVLYRVHGGQMSAREARMSEGALVALERACRRDPELVARERAAFRLGRGRHEALARRRRAAVRDLLVAVSLRPRHASSWAWLARALLRSARRVR